MFRPSLRGGSSGPPSQSEDRSEARSERLTLSEVRVRYSDPASGAGPVALPGQSDVSARMFGLCQSVRLKSECPTLLLSQRADILVDYIRRPSSTLDIDEHNSRSPLFPKLKSWIPSSLANRFTPFLERSKRITRSTLPSKQIPISLVSLLDPSKPCYSCVLGASKSL